MRSPLLLAAVAGWVRQGAWAVLVYVTFAVAALAAASAPMYDEASRNAVFADRWAAVPPTAARSDAAVVRLTAAASPRSADQQVAVRELREVPNLTEPRLGGSSVGSELVGKRDWRSTVGTPARRTPARLFAVEDPATVLVPVAATDPPVGPPGPGGVWLPQPVADEIGARAGDTVTVAVTAGAEERTAQARVAGVYATAGRLPADPSGARTWARQRSDLPADTDAPTVSAYLLIADVATVERLADETGDRVLWWAEADLAPGTTLAAARETAAGVDHLRRRYARLLAGDSNAVVSPRVTSGIGRIAAESAEVAEVVARRTRGVEWAATAVGLGSVLGVALLSVRRRLIELRHGVGTGVPPVAVGGLWFVEHLGPAVLAGGTGWLGAWALVGRLGPPGELTARSMVPALVAAGVAALVGPMVAAGAAGVTAARRVRPAAPLAPTRARPWGLLVVVAAAVAVGGLWGVPAATGVGLAVPLLVLAAFGVIVGTVLVRLAALRRRAAPATRRRRFVAAWLVRRRLAAGGERPFTVTVLAAGLGMLAFALCAVDSVAANTEDRVAVTAGAEAVAQIAGSWQLDPEVAEQPPPPEPPAQPEEGLVPGVRTPALPAHSTLVWRIDADTSLDHGTRDLLAIDPEKFQRVASWGRGDALAAARRTVGRLAAVDPATAVPGRPIPAIVVGDADVAGIDDIPVDLAAWTGRLEVIAHLPTFPGLGNRPLYVVPDIVTFTHLGMFDPRLRPRPGVSTGLFVRTYLWTAAGTDGVAEVLTARDIQPERVDTAAQVRQRPTVVAAAQSRGYQLAVAAYLALLAVVALGVFSERTASAGRSGDLMLARVGVGRGRVLRARAGELATLVAAALVAAVGGLAVLAPLAGRLLDEDPGREPELRFTVPPGAVLWTAAAAGAAILAATALAFLRTRTREEGAYRDDG